MRMPEASPPPCATLVELLRHRAAQHPRRKAFAFLRGGEGAASESLSYGELDLQARRIAARLQRHFDPGDRVLLAYSSGVDFIPALFGCLYAGVVAVLAHPPSGTTDVARLERMACETGAVGLCTGTTGFNLSHLGATLPGLQKRLRCLATPEAAAAGSPEAWTPPRIEPHSAAFLQYTSGSTGVARGVRVSHANVLHNQRLIQCAFNGSSRTRALSWLPPSHDMGLIGQVIQPLYLGITSILMPPGAFVSKPARWLQAITDHRATISGGPNFAYELCIRRITSEQMRTLDLSRWEVAYNGSEMVRAETLERFADKFAACGLRRDALLSCYGLAEATLFVSASPVATFPAVRRLDADALRRQRVRAAGDDTGEVRRVVSCGPSRTQLLRIVDPDSRLPCPPGHVGEIWISGESVVSGYWNDSDASARSFDARLAQPHSESFLRTGDLGFIHDGELHLTGRLDDLVVIAGRQYDPGDIEDAVRASHPVLSDGDAAAFSVDPTDSIGEGRLVVLCELQRGRLRRVPDADLETAARSAVRAGFGVDLGDMIFVPRGSLPKTSNGRIRRNASRDAYLQNTLGPVATSHPVSAKAGAAVGQRVAKR